MTQEDINHFLDNQEESNMQFDTTKLFEEQQLRTLGHLYDLRKELNKVITELEVKYLKIY